MPATTADNASEHVVQLFDSSKSLVVSVSRFLLNGLERGENVLLVATPEHRELLTRRLDESGWMVRTLVAANRLVILDAGQTLEKFMRQGVPSAVAFAEVVGSVVHRLAAGKRLWIYGEMVDVLVARGNDRGAQQLEAIWNVLGARECFSLFCGYASGHFGDPRSAKTLAGICALHDRVERKPSDILAEFLLAQQDVKVAAGC